jgi:hypothetical protein
MPLPHKLGTLTPVIYFRDANGHILLAPYSDFATPSGYERYEAGTLAEIDRLTAQLREQELRTLRREHQHEGDLYELVHRRVRDRLYERLTSASTSALEKDFIRAYLELRSERQRRIYHARYEEYNFYLHAREFDLGKRDAASEEWKGQTR